MSATFKLDGKMIPRSVKRMFDERREPRNAAHTAATMEHRGRRHDVAIANAKAAAMVNVQAIAAEAAQDLVARLSGVTVSAEAADMAVRRQLNG